MAMSTVPPPKSRSATPTSRSSGVSTASAEASGDSTMSTMLISAFSTHRTRLRVLGRSSVTTCTRASRRIPVIPRGSLIPGMSSMMNSWVRT